MKHCPTCGHRVEEKAGIQKPLPVRQAISMLRRQKRAERKATFSRAGLKRLHGLRDSQIDEIWPVDVFGKTRYDKLDVLRYIQSGKQKYQSKILLYRQPPANKLKS